MVVITAKELTEEDRRQLAGGVRKVFVKDRDLRRLLDDVRRSVARNAAT